MCIHISLVSVLKGSSSSFYFSPKSLVDMNDVMRLIFACTFQATCDTFIFIFIIICILNQSSDDGGLLAAECSV